MVKKREKRPKSGSFGDRSVGFGFKQGYLMVYLTHLLLFPVIDYKTQPD